MMIKFNLERYHHKPLAFGLILACALASHDKVPNEIREAKWSATKFSEEYHPCRDPGTKEIVQLGSNGKTAFTIKVHKQVNGERTVFAAKLPLWNESDGGRGADYRKMFKKETEMLTNSWNFTSNTIGLLKMQGVEEDKCVLMELGQMTMLFDYRDTLNWFDKHLLDFLTGLWTITLLQDKLIKGSDDDDEKYAPVVHQDLSPGNVYRNSVQLFGQTYYKYVVADYDFARTDEEKTEMEGQIAVTKTKELLAYENINDLYASIIKIGVLTENPVLAKSGWGTIPKSDPSDLEEPKDLTKLPPSRKLLYTVYTSKQGLWKLRNACANGSKDFKKLAKTICEIWEFVATEKIHIALTNAVIKDKWADTQFVLKNIIQNLIGMTQYDKETSALAFKALDNCLSRIIRGCVANTKDRKKQRMMILEYIMAHIPKRYVGSMYLKKTLRVLRPPELNPKPTSHDEVLYKWYVWCGLDAIDQVISQTKDVQKNNKYSATLKTIMELIMTRYPEGSGNVSELFRKACCNIVRNVEGIDRAEDKHSKKKRKGNSKGFEDSCCKDRLKRLLKICGSDKEFFIRWENWSGGVRNSSRLETVESADSPSGQGGAGADRRRMLHRLDYASTL